MNFRLPITRLLQGLGLCFVRPAFQIDHAQLKTLQELDRAVREPAAASWLQRKESGYGKDK